ncbi:CAP domain-containing protein [Microdochium bolleyi]|uniref:CAP domain-containing protein n=1 Tax=Microdochium bolleyi TaxID=196109 RepID=A0A136IX00_9PEZI|nr:CAP domain-containing protein [Microdochium bolleyi]
MMRFVLAAGLASLLPQSLAHGGAASCHDGLARCFHEHRESAAEYCAALSTVTSTVEQVVTQTTTVTATSSDITTTDSTSSSSSTSVTIAPRYYPSKPNFPCTKCYKATRLLSACACIGVPQQTTTVTSAAISTSTVTVPAYSTTATSSLTTSSETTSASESSSSTTASSTASSTTSSEVITTSSTTTSGSTTSSSTTTTSSAAPVVTDQAYIDTILRHHNVHRSNHSASDLAWSSALAETARKITETCVYSFNTVTDGGGYGQNIGAGFPSNSMGSFITNGLYNPEVNSYTYYGGEPDYSTVGQWGHFSQIIWKGTSAIGCYTNDCSATGLANAPGIPPYFTVCNYLPAGNVVGAFTSNIGAPLGRPSITQSYGCVSQPNPDVNCVEPN